MGAWSIALSEGEGDSRMGGGNYGFRWPDAHLRTLIWDVLEIISVVPAAGARPPRRAALALLPLVPRTRTRLSLALAGRFPAVLSSCLLRIAPRATPARMQFSCASTDDRRTNDTTCGPQELLTGSLHYRGTRSVRSPLRRRRASTRDPYRHPLAMRPPRKVWPFCFLNYYWSHKGG